MGLWFLGSTHEGGGSSDATQGDEEADEAANNDLTIVQIDRRRFLRPTVEEHQTISLCLENFNPPIVEDNGDNQLMTNEAIDLRYISKKSLKHPQSSIGVESSFGLEAIGDERAVQCSVDVATNTYSSAMQKNEGPLPVEKESFPFTKSSHLWEIVESMEVFRLMPQYPHFRPLENVNEEFREGIAMGHMLSFSNLMETTCKARLDDPRSMFENKLKALTELEELGFNGQPIRSRLEELVKIKDIYSELDVRLKTAEMEFNYKKRQFNEIQESITRLNVQLQAFFTEKEMKCFEIIELQKTADEIKENIRSIQLDFDSMVAAPWKKKSPLGWC